MVLKNKECVWRKFGVFFVAISFILMGCGEVEEVTQEEQPQGKKPMLTQASKEAEDPMEEVLRNFVGDLETTSESKSSGKLAPAQMAQYEKEMEQLRTENTELKQKLIKLEQENRGINARLAEVEAKYAAEKLRADKAEELAKGTAVAVQPPTVQPSVEEPSEPAPTAAVTISSSTYDEAIKAFNSHKYKEAETKFKALAESADNPKVKNRATYWLGETYYATKRYKEALNKFQETLKYKQSEKKADAQFMIAQTYERLGDVAKAKAAYEKFIKNYPMSKNIKRAKDRLSKL